MKQRVSKCSSTTTFEPFNSYVFPVLSFQNLLEEFQNVAQAGAVVSNLQAPGSKRALHRISQVNPPFDTFFELICVDSLFCSTIPSFLCAQCTWSVYPPPRELYRMCESKYDKPADIRSNFYPECVAKLPDLQGKDVAITGCTTGTGFHCVRACPSKGAHVVLLNRSSDRATAAHASISKEYESAKVTFVPCDLTSFDSVRLAAGELKELFAATGIEVLCNNADVMALEDKACPEGYDLQMKSNCM
jgi:hypothetical protein